MWRRQFLCLRLKQTCWNWVHTWSQSGFGVGFRLWPALLKMYLLVLPKCPLSLADISAHALFIDEFLRAESAALQQRHIRKPSFKLRNRHSSQVVTLSFELTFPLNNRIIFAPHCDCRKSRIFPVITMSSVSCSFLFLTLNFWLKMTPQQECVIKCGLRALVLNQSSDLIP